MEEVVVVQKSSSCSSATSDHKMVSYGTFAKGEELDGDLRRGPWTVDEDLLLINYISHHGEGRWNSLARAAGLKRTGKSCRLRWLNYLRPDVRRGNITPEEQLLILDLHSRWGNRWSKIAGELPGRTDNEIKNFWRTSVQKHARHLRCDVNSERFRDLMRRIWMPRLHLHRIHSTPANYFNINNMPNYNSNNYSGHQPPIPPPNPNYYPNIINNIHDQQYCYNINKYYYSTNSRTIFTTTSPSSSSSNTNNNNNNNNSSTSAATASADMITTVHQLEGSELLPTTAAASFDTIDANGGGGGCYLEMDQSFFMWAGGGVRLQQLPDSICCADAIQMPSAK